MRNYTKRRLVCGVGVNDSDLPTISIDVEKVIACPFYRVWHNMLIRCYSKKYQDKHPSYSGCSVCEEWLAFSNFKKWMASQDWHGKQLDKDLLIAGNKIYHPSGCLFVDQLVNKFICESFSARGGQPLGVYWHSGKMKFHAQCGNPFTKKREHIGYFSCQEKAHAAWMARKRDLSIQLSKTQENNVVAAALINRYS